MATTNVIERRSAATGLEPDPLLSSHISLAAGMRVWVDKHLGDVPMIGVVTDRAHIVISVDAGEATGINAAHVAVAEQLAAAACTFRDALREVVPDAP